MPCFRSRMCHVCYRNVRENTVTRFSYVLMLLGSTPQEVEGATAIIMDLNRVSFVVSTSEVLSASSLRIGLPGD